jgi:hypothetical protein
MKTCELYRMRTCLGCAKRENEARAMMAFPNHQYLCDECVLLSVAIFAQQSAERTRIYFIDEINAIIRGPTEIVAKWKELRANKPDSTVQEVK